MPKNAGPRRPAGRRQGGWLSFFVGLTLGLAVAVFVYLHPERVPAPGRGAATARSATPDAPLPETQVAAANKPRFDFYTILPEREVKVPEWEATPPPEPGPRPQSKPEAKPPLPSERPATPDASGAYMIQVGSFQRYQDADRVKAKLALAGVSAGIQRVVINGSDVWYRVRVGPFNDLKSLQGARQRLTQGRFNYMLVKVKPGEGSG